MLGIFFAQALDRMRRYFAAFLFEAARLALVVRQVTGGKQQHAHGGHVLLEGGGRKAVDFRCFEIVADVEGADVLHALPAAVLQEGKERAERPPVAR
jgi:hypothetical protein